MADTPCGYASFSSALTHAYTCAPHCTHRPACLLPYRSLAHARAHVHSHVTGPVRDLLHVDTSVSPYTAGGGGGGPLGASRGGPTSFLCVGQVRVRLCVCYSVVVRCSEMWASDCSSRCALLPSVTCTRPCRILTHINHHTTPVHHHTYTHITHTGQLIAVCRRVAASHTHPSRLLFLALFTTHHTHTHRARRARWFWRVRGWCLTW